MMTHIVTNDTELLPIPGAMLLAYCIGRCVRRGAVEKAPSRRILLHRCIHEFTATSGEIGQEWRQNQQHPIYPARRAHPAQLSLRICARSEEHTSELQSR